MARAMAPQLDPGSAPAPDGLPEQVEKLDAAKLITLITMIGAGAGQANVKMLYAAARWDPEAMAALLRDAHALLAG